MSSLKLLALILETFGSLLVGYAALSVHHRVLNEHRVDDRVFRVMRIEQKLGILGMVLISLAFILSVIAG
jgi:hypothetical protein